MAWNPLARAGKDRGSGVIDYAQTVLILIVVVDVKSYE